MNVVRSHAHYYGLIFLVCALSLMSSGCENPGSVGGSFSGRPAVEVDTLEVKDLGIDSLSMYSGSLAYFSAGEFEDPQFGNIKTTALIKPSLYSSSSSADSLSEDATMKLKLMIEQPAVYGDSLQEAEYDLVEIDQLWRARAWKYSDQIQLSDNAPVASFSIGRQDSIEVPLSSAWINKYRSYFESEDANKDSLYRYNFYGFALVPRNKEKVLPFVATDCKFIVENPEADTFDVAVDQWAFSLERSGKQAPPQGSYDIFNTMEHLLTFDLDLNKDRFGTVNISKVDLVMYQNDDVLEQTINEAPGESGRPPVTTAMLHYINPDEASSALFPGNPLVTGIYEDGDGAFHFNITSFAHAAILNGLEEGNKFYITLQQNNGILGSSLIYNTQAVLEKQPKLIVTSLKSEGN